MKAILRRGFGGTEQLVIKDVPAPTPTSGEVLIRVKAFGINRAEIYMRQGLWGDVSAISGIECVGVVEADPSGAIRSGQTVAAIMGGMGRTRNGSYAEFVTVPATNVFALNSNLAWQDLAAIPESYATAWSCLFNNMQLQPGNTVVIRGGTSALGQAAINIAAEVDDVTVIATTRDATKSKQLMQLGCSEVLIEHNALSEEVNELYSGGANCVMDIIGNTTLLDSLKMVNKNGYVCNAGFLGGGETITFNPLTDLPSSANLNFFGSFVLGSDHFPLSNIPMQAMVDKSLDGLYQSKPAKVFDFEQIALAHQMMETNQAFGKIVIKA